MATYLDSLLEPEQRRYKEKLKMLSLESTLIDPFDIEKEKWIDDITLWPPVEYGEIYSYLIETPGQFTKESLKAYKSLDAFNYYISGWVQEVLLHDLGSNCLLTAKVRRMTIYHQAWVCADKKTGAVITGHCKCMAGCGEVCSHVAAIHFKVEACIRLKIGAQSCTDLPCVWNQAFSKHVQNSKVVDINFFKPAKKRTSKEAKITAHEEEKSKRRSIESPKPRLNANVVFQKIFELNPTAAIFSVIPGFQMDHTSISPTQQLEIEPSLPIPLWELYDPNAKKLTLSELKERCSTTFNAIQVTQKEADFLQKTTVSQSSCTTWYDHRKGRITASHFYDVFTHMTSTRPNSKVYPKSIVKRIMQYYSCSDNVPALKWGRENEDNARKDYISHMKDKHTNLRVDSSGLVVNPNYPHLGASPDGIVSCDCCENQRVLEIKCPFKYRDESPTADGPLSDQKFFLMKNVDNEVHLSTVHKYYYQVQGQIAICDVRVCDFVCWTEKGLFIEQIGKNDGVIRDMFRVLKDFFVSILLPELLTRKVESEVNQETSQTTCDNQVFCVCRKPESGKMVMCDNKQCSIEWFHFTCVGLKRKPRGKWLCPNCI